MEKYNSSAKVIDGTLILTLPDAIQPVVWQMQLGQTKSSALEIRDQKDGTWLLVLKTPRNETLEIAPFDTKEKALKALMAVSRAMEKAHGQLAPYSGSATYPVPAVIPVCTRFSWLCRLLRGALYAFLGWLLLVILWVSLVWFANRSENASYELEAQSEAAITREAPVGAPVSADDFLNNQ